jgi:hypothetical protein
MTSFNIRCVAYALIALVALAGTASQLPQYLPLGLVQGNVQFWTDTLANPASRFITIDVLVVFLVVWPWMIGEARRLRMGGLLAYFLGSILVAFSVALPLFMLHREFALQRHTSAEDASMNTAGAPFRSWTGWSVAAVAVVAALYTSKAAGLI